VPRCWRQLAERSERFEHKAADLSREHFRGRIPADLLYDPDHDMWVRQSGIGVEIGATSFGIHLAGEIIAFTAKPKGAAIEYGRGLGTVECAKTVLAVHAPIAFMLEEGNESLEERPSLLNSDPYAAWMARGRPTHWDTDQARLVDAAAYRAHIRRCEPEAEFI
jgi:glycine cleavage system H protein